MRRIVVAMLLTTAACGGGGSTGSSGPTTTVEPGRPVGTAITIPSTTIKTATVGQVASIVAKHSSDLRRYAADARTCQILEDPRCGVAARINVMSLSVVASTLDVNLRGAAEDRPNNNLYIGAYPAELVRLVAATRSAIAEVTTAGDAIGKGSCSGASPGPTCAAAYLQMSFAAGHLVQQLDAWAPYL